jgi:hypothetical protein
VGHVGDDGRRRAVRVTGSVARVRDSTNMRAGLARRRGRGATRGDPGDWDDRREEQRETRARLRVIRKDPRVELDPCEWLEQRVRSEGPARRVLCALAARFASTHAWERLGYARQSDYASEQLGVSPRSLLDWAHVDAALADLPALEHALVAGELGWTKLRLLARVARASDERAWLALARRVSTRALAREVRAIDVGARAQPGTAEGDVEGSEEGPRTTLVVRASPEARALWRRCHGLARRASGEAVPMWQAMEWVAAEVVSALPVEPGDVLAADEDQPREKSHQAPSQRTEVSATPSTPAVEAAATSDVVEIPAALARLLDGLGSASAFELHRRLKAAVRYERRFETEVAPVLLRVFEAKLFRSLGSGYSRFDDYAADRLGFSARRARMLLRIARAARRCPSLAAAWNDGRLTWVKAHELVPIVVLAGNRDAPAWIEWAGRVTVRRLRDDVARAVDLAATNPAAWEATGGLPEDAGERQTSADPSRVARPTGHDRFFFSAPVIVAQLFRAAVCRVRRHLERNRGRPASEDDAVRFMFEHFHEVWDESRVPRRYAVFARDGWRCTVPGCSSYRNLQDHHIVYRSRGGDDSLSNRTTLCAWHHLRGEHEGRIRVTGRAPERLHFELGLRDGQPSLASYDAHERQARRSTTMAL